MRARSSATSTTCRPWSAAARSTGTPRCPASGARTSRARSLHGPVHGANVADWPLTYDELEPFYDEVEARLGVQGDIHRMPARDACTGAPPPPVRDAAEPADVRRLAARRGRGQARLPRVSVPDGGQLVRTPRPARAVTRAASARASAARSTPAGRRALVPARGVAETALSCGPGASCIASTSAATGVARGASRTSMRTAGADTERADVVDARAVGDRDRAAAVAVAGAPASAMGLEIAPGRSGAT